MRKDVYKRQAVDDVSFSVESGEKLGIIGESGDVYKRQIKLYSSRKDKWVKMKRYKKIIILAVGNLLVLSACSKQPDFDSKSYVQSSLDAYYHGDYKDYANLLEISEKDAKKEIEEDFNESI